MSELITNLNKIESCKLEIKSAIEAKGVDMTGLSFQDYASAIGSITTQFVTETLSVSDNGTYTPGEGVDGFSQVVVDVPQSVTGYTEKDLTENNINIQVLSNSASFVAQNVFNGNNKIEVVSLTQCLEVRQSAFYNCSKISSLYLPICKSIGTGAFTSCRSITVVDFPYCSIISEGAFANCNKLESVSLPVCEIIGINAFINCSSLTSLMASNCRYIHNNGLSNCNKLTDVDFPYCSYLGNAVFQNCNMLENVNLPNCYQMGVSVFSNCRSLSTISLPHTYSIGNSTFASCSSLASISIPKCVSIGGLVFPNAIMSELDLPNGVYISGALANGASTIKTVKMPIAGSMTSWYGNGVLLNNPNLSQLWIGTEYYSVIPYDSVFKNTPANKLMNGEGSIYVNKTMYDSYATATGWSSLSSLLVSVGDDTPLLSVSDGTLYGCTGVVLSNWSNYVSTSSITSINLPNCRVFWFSAFKQNTLTNLNAPACEFIQTSAFCSCKSLSHVVLTNTEFISNSAFYSCLLLEELSLPKCTYIGSAAFFGCSSLSTVTLPVCTLIDDGAFRYTSVNSLTLGASIICKLALGNVFGYTPIESGTGSIYVPASLVDGYKSAQYWSVYSSIIFPIPE